jgi:hypothetical protein
MSYYAKDCLFLFFIGLIPSMLFNQGVACWFVICLTRYLIIRSKWTHQEKTRPKTKKDFEALGYKIRDDWFDENGNFTGAKF